MNRPDRWKLALWILWSVVYAPGLGVGAIAVYRSERPRAVLALVGFDPSGPDEWEGAGKRRLLLVCDHPRPGIKATVVATGGNGTAKSGRDFTPIVAPVSLDPTRRTTPLDIEVLDSDRPDRVPLILTLTVEGPAAAIDLTKAFRTLTLLRRAARPGDVKVSFTTDHAEATEGTHLSARLKFNPETAEPVVVSYKVDGGEERSSVVEKGQTSSTLSVEVGDDAVYSGDREFRVTLHNSRGLTLGEPATLSVVVHDDEPTPVVRVEGLATEIATGSGKPFRLRVTVTPPSAHAVTLWPQVTSGPDPLIDVPTRFEVPPRTPQLEFPLRPRAAGGGVSTGSVVLTIDRADGARLDPSSNRFTLTVHEEKLKGSLLVILLGPEALTTNNALEGPLWDVFEARQNGLIRGGFVVHNKGEGTRVWLPNKTRHFPVGNPYLPGRDTIDEILNAVFDDVAALRPKAENPDFDIVIFWPTDAIHRFALDAKALRPPRGNRAHLYILGTNINTALKDAMLKIGGTAEFIGSARLANESLKGIIDADLTGPSAP